MGERRLENLVWTYPTPLPESLPIAGLAAFYNERVEIRVDGVPENQAARSARDGSQAVRDTTAAA